MSRSATDLDTSTGCWSSGADPLDLGQLVQPWRVSWRCGSYNVQRCVTYNETHSQIHACARARSHTNTHNGVYSALSEDLSSTIRFGDINNFFSREDAVSSSKADAHTPLHAHSFCFSDCFKRNSESVCNCVRLSHKSYPALCLRASNFAPIAPKGTPDSVRNI